MAAVGGADTEKQTDILLFADCRLWLTITLRSVSSRIRLIIEARVNTDDIEKLRVGSVRSIGHPLGLAC